MFKVKVTEKIQNLRNVNCFSRRYSLNRWPFNYGEKKVWFAVFNDEVRAKDHIIRIIYSELLILLQQNLLLLFCFLFLFFLFFCCCFFWLINLNWIVFWKDWIALLWSSSRSQERFRFPVNVYLDDISSTAEPSVTKHAMVIECLAKRLVCWLQVQSHSYGSFNQI